MRQGWGWMGAGLLAGVLSSPGLAQQPDPEAVERAAQEAIRRVEAQEKAKEEAARKAQPPSAPKLAVDHDHEAWKSAEKCGTAACFEAYLEDYPKGRYARMARARLKPKPEPKPAPKPEPVSRPVVVTPPPEPARPKMTGPALVRISGGCFQMGSPESEVGREPWEPNEKQHRVCVEDFAISQDELTVGEFKQFIVASSYRTDAEKDAGGKDGCFAWSATDGKGDWRSGYSWRKPGYTQRDNYPVVCVSWNDAVAYTQWLSRETGQRYRLPTEAEWEYAARARTTTARYWGDDPDEACTYANVADQTKGPEGNVWPEKHNCNDGYWYPAPVGRFQANDFRLNDMLGNVWEWTCSAYDKDYGGAEKECTNNVTDGPLALRGGSWYNLPAGVRSAIRYRTPPADRTYFTGFRLARSL